MPLATSLRVSVDIASIVRHEEAVRKLAERARKDADTLHWMAYQVIGGQSGHYFYASQAETWAELVAREAPDAMAQRLFGEAKGRELLEQINKGIHSMQNVVLQDRPELSYAGEQTEEPAPLLIRTRLKVRPGGQDACEELIRKVAEAVPKADDPRRFTTLQVVTGDLQEYSIVQPVRDPQVLDQQRTVANLLNEAFGSDEGGLVWRTGRESLAEVRSDLCAHREDLSNAIGAPREGRAPARRATAKSTRR